MKKCIKSKLIAAFLAVNMVIGIASPVANESSAAKVAKLGFKKVKLEVGQKKKVVIKNKKKKAKYTYKSSAVKKAGVSKSGLIVAKAKGKAVITVKEKFNKKNRLVGKVTVTVKAKKISNTPVVSVTPVVTDNPATAIPQSTLAPATPTATVAAVDPTAEPTPDVYSEELFTMYIQDISDKKYEVNGATCDVTMQYFEGEAEGEYFNGNIKRASSNVIKAYKEGYKDGKSYTTARYILEGKDSSGNACSLFIEDNGIINADKSITGKPTIITKNEELAWLQTADIQTRVIDRGDGNKEISFMWNKDNTEPVPYPTVTRPDETKSYTEELFRFAIGIGASDEVPGSDGASSSMINFTCKTAEGFDKFVGEGVDNFADTRMQFKGQVQTLSARYIMVGEDADGDECTIYVENNGIDDNGMVTEPTIITDNPDWAWIETAPLHGTVSWGTSLTIHMWSTKEAYDAGQAEK